MTTIQMLDEVKKKRHDFNHYEMIAALCDVIQKQDDAMKTSLLVKDECGECGEITAVRYEIPVLINTKSEVAAMLAKIVGRE